MIWALIDVVGVWPIISAVCHAELSSADLFE